jgi:hypothetical protein
MSVRIVPYENGGFEVDIRLRRGCDAARSWVWNGTTSISIDGNCACVDPNGKDR